MEAAIAKLCSAEVELLEGLRVQTKREKIVRGLKQKQTQEGKYAEMIAGVEKRREDLQVSQRSSARPRAARAPSTFWDPSLARPIGPIHSVPHSSPILSLTLSLSLSLSLCVSFWMHGGSVKP